MSSKKTGGESRSAERKAPALELVVDSVRRSERLERTAAPLPPPQAHSDDKIIRLWIHGKSAHTTRAYRGDIEEFRQQIPLPLHQVTLGDLQEYADYLCARLHRPKPHQSTSAQRNLGKKLAPSTLARKLAAVKSLFSFAQKVGYVSFNPAAAISVPKFRDTLAERILEQDITKQIIALESNERNRALLRLLYATGARVSEVCALKWRDLRPVGSAGQVTLFGKGGKTRAIKLSRDTYRELLSLRQGASGDEPVFQSRKKKHGGHLTQSSVWSIIRRAARRAGVVSPVSPHWMRHAHATHALEAGASLQLVQSTLGHANWAITGRYVHVVPGDSSSRYIDV